MRHPSSLLVGSRAVARGAVLVVALASAAACTDDKIVGPRAGPADVRLALATTAATAAEVRALAAQRNIGPLVRPASLLPKRSALVLLGQALAFDKELSGNRDISCMSCHLPSHATGDGLSLSIGQGATGLGPTRTHPDGTFIPRNAPPLFNLFALSTLFWDGRVSVDGGGQFTTPARGQLTAGMTRVLEFGAPSALALFPVANRAEMRGAPGTNELADYGDDDFQGIWNAIMRRLGQIPAYRQMFEAAYPETKFDQMSFAHASNAIAGFFIEQFSATDSPWDRFLAGDDRALTKAQLEGAKTFLSIRCSLCHNGPALTDGKFHNVALAQIGPGEGDGPGGNDDFGRSRVTGVPAERYAFRTTPLRNVEFTAPYGHAGQFTDSRAFIEHYSESHLKLRSYDVSQLIPVLRGTLVPNFDDVLATRDTILDGVVLPDDVIDKLHDYMQALSDRAAMSRLASAAPDRVPSGLPVDK